MCSIAPNKATVSSLTSRWGCNIDTRIDDIRNAVHPKVIDGIRFAAHLKRIEAPIAAAVTKTTTKTSGGDDEAGLRRLKTATSTTRN